LANENLFQLSKGLYTYPEARGYPVMISFQIWLVNLLATYIVVFYKLLEFTNQKTISMFGKSWIRNLNYKACLGHRKWINTLPVWIMIVVKICTDDVLGKSMLIDLFANCLPTRKKRRFHFNTFMLETFAKLEEHRKTQVATGNLLEYEYPLLWLARDLIKTSPILFLDEFQLPDRVASKVMSNLMTSFFQLGGVLIATSNRMPEELAKAAGIEFAPPPSNLESLAWKLGLRKSPSGGTRQSEFTDFLAVLKARCEVWEMEGVNDYRRTEFFDTTSTDPDLQTETTVENRTYNTTQSTDFSSPRSVSDAVSTASKLPSHFWIVQPGQDGWHKDKHLAQKQAAEKIVYNQPELWSNPWSSSSMRVYGRIVKVPRQQNGVSCWSFEELCGARLGPADYITLASTYHTLILLNVPILTHLEKNEARRFITLLDALYEARCKLWVTAAAGPDDIFFPETKADGISELDEGSSDAVHSETFAEAYQDVTAPFRPNITSYDGRAAGDEPDMTHARLAGILSEDALEDDPPNRMRRNAKPYAHDEEDYMVKMHPEQPQFSQTSAYTGEDERFAYKRARSRLWEMCGEKWWARNDEGWWRPLDKKARKWEISVADLASGSNASAVTIVSTEDVGDPSKEGIGSARYVDEKQDEVMFRHGASPFRKASEPPPKFSWTHIWGTVKWGKKAGAWGQGVEGLAERKRKKGDD
jgi:peroxisome-assembly ATPase